MYYKIIDHPNLVRDATSKAVLNIDHNSKVAFLASREVRRNEKSRIDRLEKDIESMEKKLDMILGLLQK